MVAESQGTQYGNRDIISTGIRSYQVGSLGGSTCGVKGCTMDHFAADADLLDANSLTVMKQGAVVDANTRGSAGPVWRRPVDDRYYLVLLDEQSRAVQVAMVHPGAIPASLKAIVPALPNTITRAAVDSLMGLRLPN